MKTSALACYLEAIANGLRASKSVDVPHIKWTSFKGPTVLHIGATKIPVPAHADCPDLACIFPGLKVVTAEAHGEKISQRNEAAETIATLRGTIERMQYQEAMDQSAARGKIDAARKTEEALRNALAQAHAELKAADQTLMRLRQAPHAIEPARVPVAPARPPVAPVVAPQVDLINAILSDYSPKEAGPAFEVVKPPLHVARQEAVYQSPDTRPVLVLCFPLNGQGKTLAKAAVALDEVKALFQFKFINPKDATAGGYWLAKDATGPQAQELARTLAKEGATIGTSLPEYANR